MVFARFITRKGRKFGPYYYRSVRNRGGKVRSIYLGRTGTIRVDPSRILIVSGRKSADACDIPMASQCLASPAENLIPENMTPVDIKSPEAQVEENPEALAAVQGSLPDEDQAVPESAQMDAEPEDAPKMRRSPQ